MPLRPPRARGPRCLRTGRSTGSAVSSRRPHGLRRQRRQHGVDLVVHRPHRRREAVEPVGHRLRQLGVGPCVNTRKASSDSAVALVTSASASTAMRAPTPYEWSTWTMLRTYCVPTHSAAAMRSKPCRRGSQLPKKRVASSAWPSRKSWSSCPSDLRHGHRQGQFHGVQHRCGVALRDELPTGGSSARRPNLMGGRWPSGPTQRVRQRHELGVEAQRQDETRHLRQGFEQRWPTSSGSPRAFTDVHPPPSEGGPREGAAA
jgi:hypothetical protein